MFIIKFDTDHDIFADGNHENAITEIVNGIMLEMNELQHDDGIIYNPDGEKIGYWDSVCEF